MKIYFTFFKSEKDKSDYLTLILNYVVKNQNISMIQFNINILFDIYVYFMLLFDKTRNGKKYF